MYTLEQMKLITGLSERTLRRHIADELLVGTKRSGKWSFSGQQVENYLSSSLIRKKFQKQNMNMIMDFMFGVDIKEGEVIHMFSTTMADDEVNEFLSLTNTLSNKHLLRMETVRNLKIFTFKGRYEDAIKLQQEAKKYE